MFASVNPTNKSQQNHKLTLSQTVLYSSGHVQSESLPLSTSRSSEDTSKTPVISKALTGPYCVELIWVDVWEIEQDESRNFLVIAATQSENVFFFFVCVTFQALNGAACVWVQLWRLCQASLAIIEIENVSSPACNEPFYDSLSRRWILLPSLQTF